MIRPVSVVLGICSSMDVSDEWDDIVIVENLKDFPFLRIE